MPIYSDAAHELFKEWQIAHTEDDAAIKALSALCSAHGSMSEIIKATERMEAAHTKAMNLYERLQAYKLNK